MAEKDTGRQEAKPKRGLPDLSNQALLDEMKSISSQINSPGQEKRVDLATKMIGLSIQAVRSEDQKASLVAYKTLRSIQGEISNLAFQSEEEQKRFQGLYDGALKSAEKSSSLLGVIAHDLMDNSKKMMPTLSSFGKQLISNTHPALKIAMDIAKDANSYLKDAKGRADQENQQGKEMALSEAEVLLKQSRAVESQEKLVVKQEGLIDEQRKELVEASEERKEVKKERKEGPLVARMEAVKANTLAQVHLLETLLDAIGGGVVQASPRAGGMSTDNKEVLDRLEDQVSKLDTANSFLESLDKHQDTAIKMQQEAVRKQEVISLKALEDENKGREGPASGSLERIKPNNKNGGFLSSLIGETLGNFLAAGTPSILGAMLKPLAKIAGSALRAVPVIGAVIAGVTALFDFVDGFQNAGEILGKENVNTFDKVSAGIGSVLGGLTSIVDFTASLFGIETGFAPIVKESVSKFLAAIPDFIVDTFDSVMSSFSAMKEDAMTKAGEVWTKVTSIFSELMDFIPKMIMQAIPGSGHLKKGFDTVKDWLSGDTNKPGKAESVSPLLPPSKVDTIRQEEQAMAAAEKEAKTRDDKAKGNTINAPITNNTRVDASSTSVFNQPMSSRNNDRSNWAGMGGGAKTV